MPGRANQMSAGDAYNMAGSRWAVPLKVLTNKKALDMALQQHVWTMQQESLRAAGGDRQEHIRGQYRMKEQEIQNKAAGKSNLEYQVLTQAVELAKSQGLDLESPDGQKQFQSIYQALLYEASGGKSGSMLAAGGVDFTKIPAGNSSLPEPVGGMDPRRMLPGYASYGVPQGSGGQKLTVDDPVAVKIFNKAGRDPKKAAEMARKLGYTFE